MILKTNHVLRKDLAEGPSLIEEAGPSFHKALSIKSNKGKLCEGKAHTEGSPFHGKSPGPYSPLSDKLALLDGLRGNGCCNTFNVLKFLEDTKEVVLKILSPSFCVSMPILYSSMKEGNSRGVCHHLLLLERSLTPWKGVSLQKIQRSLEKPKEGLSPVMSCLGDAPRRVEVSNGFQYCGSQTQVQTSTPHSMVKGRVLKEAFDLSHSILPPHYCFAVPWSKGGFFAHPFELFLLSCFIDGWFFRGK